MRPIRGCDAMTGSRIPGEPGHDGRFASTLREVTNSYEDVEGDDSP